MKPDFHALRYVILRNVMREYEGRPAISGLPLQELHLYDASISGLAIYRSKLDGITSSNF